MEADRLAPFMSQLPPEVARPVGCPKCRHTGYSGREGIYEIVRFDTAFAQLVHSNAPISALREFSYRRGDYLISHHAADKAAQLLVSVDEIYQKILAEESLSQQESAVSSVRPPIPSESSTVEIVPRPLPHSVVARSQPRILLVEDDKITQRVVQRQLEQLNYSVVKADDGIDALLQLGKNPFDLILSDINMPNLDGFKLIEMLIQKNIDTPVIIITGRNDEATETHGFELGIADFLRKPIDRDALQLSVRKALGN
jgi:CheY-like chemotaxis protein